MKRKLALLMAFMMATTLFTAQPAFAKSKNNVNRTVTTTTNGSIVEKDDVVFKIEKDGDSLYGEVFELKLGSGAKWNFEELKKSSKLQNAEVKLKEDNIIEVRLTEGTTDKDLADLKKELADLEVELEAFKKELEQLKVELAELEKDPVTNAAAITQKKLDITAKEGQITGKEGDITAKKAQIKAREDQVAGDLKEAKIPMLVDFDGATEGAQKVQLIATNSILTSGDYTYAVIGADDVKISVEKKNKISRTGSNEVTLVFQEIAKGSFNGKEVSLRLPKGFTFEGSKENDGRDLIVKLPDNTGNTPEAPTGKHYVKVKINPDRTARTGDVDLSVTNGKVSPSSIVVAEYVKDGVEVKAEKVLDVIAGKDVEGLYKAKVTLEENVANALLNGRYVEFSLTGAALQSKQTLRLRQISGNADLDIDETSTKALVKSTSKSNNHDDTTDTAEIVTVSDTDGSNFDLIVDRSSKDNSASKFELEIPFVVNSDVVGDIVLNVKNAGVVGEAKNGGVDVVIAKAKAPITVETTKPLPQVKIGLQQQKGSDIIVKEVETGALQDYVVDGVKVEDKKGEITYKDLSYANYTIASSKKTFGIQFDKAKVEVIESNMSLDKYATKRVTLDRNDKMKNAIQIAVDRKSTDKPAVIKVSDVLLTLDRTVPYGDVKLDANFGLASNRHNTDEFTNKTLDFEYLTTVTPVSDDKRITTIFKIGEKAYTELIGTEKVEKNADVAPFIKDNRTMLPVRYVANAIGAIVNYDPTTRVATFTKNQVVVSINIDKDVMYVNGSPVKLYTKPANVEGRIFLPLSNIAQAFGLKQGGENETIIWNQENKTVTILPQDANADEIKAAKEGKVGEDATMKEEVKEETKTEEKK